MNQTLNNELLLRGLKNQKKNYVAELRHNDKSLHK